MSHSPTTETLFGGSLRPNDPRRYLVEVMVGAVHADGHVDARELDVLGNLLREHALFAELPAVARDALLESASDALVFAGGFEARIRTAADALPWRCHRLATYAMACELVAADNVVTTDEEAFLRTLRRRLAIDSVESDALLAAAGAGSAIETADELGLAAAALLPKAVRLCAAIRSSSTEMTGDDVNQIDGWFSGLLDFRTADRIPRDRIARMALELPAVPSDRCIELASRIRGHVDRYWATTYALGAALEIEVTQWRQAPFLKLLRIAFELSERAMDRAAGHAQAMQQLRS